MIPAFVQEALDHQDAIKQCFDFCMNTPHLAGTTNGFDVPDGILPRELFAAVRLWDVHIQPYHFNLPSGKRAATIDQVYDHHAPTRLRIARGMTFMTFRYLPTGEDLTAMPLWALKKFPDAAPASSAANVLPDWAAYFTVPPDTTHTVMLSRKANGSAGHFRALRVRDTGDMRQDYVFLGGSKNYHCLVRDAHDFDTYAHLRQYNYAVAVLHACLETWHALPDPAALFRFLDDRRLTLCLEYESPNDRHIETVTTHAATIVVYAATCISACLDAEWKYWCEPPRAILRELADLGVHVIPYETRRLAAPPAFTRVLPAILWDVKREYGTEGYVLYCLDTDGRVVGLLKAKTLWYSFLRMIRERARNKLPMQKHVPALSNVVDLSASAKTAQALARATATEPATAQADTTIATVTVQTEADRTTPSAAVKKSAQRSKADEATIRQLAAGIDGVQLKHEKPSKASKRLDETYVSRLRGAMAKDGLSFPPKSAPAQAWFELAHAFGTFLNNTATEADRALLHTDFPALWARFLDETKLSDRIDTTASPEPKAIVQLRSGFAPSDEMP